MSDEFDNPFALKANEYQRDLDIFSHYVSQSAAYLSTMTGAPHSACLQFVRENIGADGKFPLRDPAVHYLQRNDQGDREVKEGTLGQFLSESIRENQLIAPTFTTYLHPTVKRSLLAGFLERNTQQRDLAKEAMFQARMDGNRFLETLKDNEQTNMKLTSNACSGAHASASTPLYNPTAHSTLTSNCRTTAGYGSAHNEKFLSGNRHYWSPDIVKNNIVSIISNTDYAALERAIGQYGIRHPSVDETMQCIRYSTQLYFRDEAHHRLIRQLVERLTDIQRSAFVYTGDLHHLMKYNEALVRTFIHRLSSRIARLHPDPDTVIRQAHEDHLALATQLCREEMRGKTVADVKGTPAYGILASTVENIARVITEYADLIRALLVTKNVPASVAHFPDSIRRSALMGDTDSTIFTVQDWVTWYNDGHAGFDDRSSAVAATMIFLSSQTIVHILARMSANFGVEAQHIFRTAMKNEYKFDVFVPTQVAKHYYASIGCQEGNLYADQKEEIKGVHLKSSNAPPAVMAHAKAMMLDIMATVMREEKLSLKAILGEVAAIEHDIRSSIMARSSYEYLRMGQIKPASAYTLPPGQSNYAHFLFWNATFGHREGMAPEPPYTSVKIPVDLKSPARLKAWLDGIEDRELAQRLAHWLVQSGKKAITTFHVPEQVIQSKGIPKEILGQIAIRKLIADTLTTHYLILESLGIYLSNRQQTRLVSDYY